VTLARVRTHLVLQELRRAYDLIHPPSGTAPFAR
jgi:hypothetical protein